MKGFHAEGECVATGQRLPEEKPAVNLYQVVSLDQLCSQQTLATSCWSQQKHTWDPGCTGSPHLAQEAVDWEIERKL